MSTFFIDSKIRIFIGHVQKSFLGYFLFSKKIAPCSLFNFDLEYFCRQFDETTFISVKSFLIKNPI